MWRTSHADCPLCRAGLRGLVIGWLVALGVCLVAKRLTIGDSPRVRSLQSLTVGPDDVLLVTLTDRDAGPSTCGALAEGLSRQWPNNLIVFLSPGTTLDALTPEDMARHGWVRA